VTQVAGTLPPSSLEALSQPRRSGNDDHMTAAPQRPGEGEAHLQLIGLQPRVEAICARWQESPREPQHMSAVWADDRDSKPYQVSHTPLGRP